MNHVHTMAQLNPQTAIRYPWPSDHSVSVIVLTPAEDTRKLVLFRYQVNFRSSWKMRPVRKEVNRMRMDSQKPVPIKQSRNRFLL